MPIDKLHQTEELSLKEFINNQKTVIRYLLQKWWLIAIISVVFCTIGFFYAQSKTPVYEAVTSFALDDEKGSNNAFAGLAASFGLDAAGSGNLFTDENILHLFSSNRIIYAALLDTFSNSSKSHADRLLEILGVDKKLDIKLPVFPLGSDASLLSRRQDSILKILQPIISPGFFQAVKPDKKVDVYNVIVQTPDENFSMSLSSSIVEQVSSLYTKIKTQKTVQTVTILQKRVDSLRKSFNYSLYSQAAILDANLNPTSRAATVGVSQKQTELSSSTAAYQELVKNLEVSKFALLKESPLFQIIDEPRFPLVRLKASRLKYGLAFAFVGAILITSILLLRRFFNSL